MIHQASNCNLNRVERFAKYSKAPLSVKKTGISFKQPAAPPDQMNKEDIGPDKQCPLHNKPHALRKCHAFWEKSMEERKRYLKEKKHLLQVLWFHQT